ncbi:MAG: hypothetical protein RL318_18 [Fibrobacterota bacterium]
MDIVKGMLALVLVGAVLAEAEVIIAVNADSGRKAISPWLYGRNNSLSDKVVEPVPDSMLALYREAGLRMLRENGGNNATKYNWRKKLTSHPDWYNNVYAHNWTYAAQTLQSELPGTQGLFAFQLLGKVAANTSNNFKDGAYNGSAWWSGVNQNLVGGGTVNAAGGNKATTNGDPSKYLMDWPADSTVGILDGWFGTGGAGLDASRFQYWSMDNEPDIWNGTHDDVVTDTMPFEDYFQRYLAVAKAARAKSPTIKLVGPVLTNEWQWWTWNNILIQDGASKRTPMEMFLKRIGQEEKASGMKLLDVFDVHLYPGYETTADIPNLLQLHRMFWDTTYAWPSSNGIHMIDGKWKTAVPNFLYGRVAKWMVTHLGDERPVALTEFGAMKAGGDVNVRNAFYASLIGTFADHGAEILTAWEWYDGWWEVLHLWSRNARTTRVSSASSQDSLVSAYSSISDAGDSMTVILVNRDPSAAQVATVNLSGFVAQGEAATLQLSGLSGETFVSHVQNALQPGSVAVSGNAMTLSLPKLSITAIRLAGKGNPVTGVAPRRDPVGALTLRAGALSNPSGARVDLLDLKGCLVRSGEGRIDLRGVASGLHLGRSQGQILRVMVP